MAFLALDGQQLTLGGIPLTLGGPSITPPIWSGPFIPGVDTAPPSVWAVGPGASAATPGPTRQLTAAYGRVLTLRVDGHAFAQFTIPDRLAESAEIVDKLSDLWVWLSDGSLVFRGRVVDSQHEIDETTHRRQVQAIDYRGMLTKAAKVEPNVPTYTGVDPAQIVWQLVQHRQAQTGGDWGITEGVGGTSGYGGRDLNTLIAGKPVGEAIDELLRREDGGEWSINPELELDRWWPRRGSDNGVVLDYGGNIARVSLSGAEFGNAAVATGSQETTPTEAETAGVGTDERGRWTVSEGFTSVIQQATLQAKANWLRDEASTIERRWVVEFAPNRWEGVSHVGLGDVVKFAIKSGSLQVATPHRVVELQFAFGENGQQTVRAGLVEEAA